MLEKKLAEERVSVREMADRVVVVKDACVDEASMIVDEDHVKDVDEDNVFVRDTVVAHVHGQLWIACGMLHSAKRHQGGSHVVVVDDVVVAVVGVAVVIVVAVAVVVDVSVAQEQLQT